MNIYVSEMSQCIRKLIIRWKIRSLDAQAQSIIDARNAALRRLMEIRREREEMQGQL